MAGEQQSETAEDTDCTSIVHRPDEQRRLLPDTTPLATESLQIPERIDSGIDSLGQWRIEIRTKNGTLLHTSEHNGQKEDINLTELPAGSPAGTLALQDTLKARYQFPEIARRPDAMNTPTNSTPPPTGP